MPKCKLHSYQYHVFCQFRLIINPVTKNGDFGGLLVNKCLKHFLALFWPNHGAFRQLFTKKTPKITIFSYRVNYEATWQKTWYGYMSVTYILALFRFNCIFILTNFTLNAFIRPKSWDTFEEKFSKNGKFCLLCKISC